MTFWLLIRRSLVYHARNHLGVVLGAAIGTTALTGALLVGDSVHNSLRDHALGRLQGAYYALNSGDRLFQQDLAERLDLSSVAVTNSAVPGGSLQTPAFARAAVLQVPGTISRQDGAARANRVIVLGVNLSSWYFVAREVRGDPAAAEQTHAVDLEKVFAEFGLSSEESGHWRAGELVLLNEPLARQLKVSAGDEVVLRVRKPSLLAQDAVITPREGNSLALRLKVGPVLPARLLGNFDLAASQAPALNALLPIDVLTQKLEQPGKANLILNGPVLRPRSGGESQASKIANSFSKREEVAVQLPSFVTIASSEEGLSKLGADLAEHWKLEDAELSVHPVVGPTNTPGAGLPAEVEIRSSRIFLDPAVASAGVASNGVGILTYLANLISKDQAGTPYSMITASAGDLIPKDMRDDEILINDWLANDVSAKPGDRLQVSYYVVDSASHLTERTNVFTVHGVVPMEGKYADRTLMPEFPGIAKAESTQDWDTGFPLIYKIREKDEAYWKRYRGTPKAYITLAAGRAMWSSRFGALTAIRFAVPAGVAPNEYRDSVARELRGQLRAESFGLQFQPVREQALRAADQAQDFGQLFIGFSLFLVVAALLLMAILFQFSLEQRQREVGTFLALGFKPKQVRRLLLGEAMMLALVGGSLGALLGLGYARAMLWALTTIWSSAVANSALRFHATVSSLVTGLLAGAITALLTIWIALRKQGRRPARELLAGDTPTAKTSQGRIARWTAVLAALMGLGSVAYAVGTGQTANAEVFFSAGSLLLIAGLATIAAWLAALEGKGSSSDLTLFKLGVRACARRRTRSVATVALLASGCFVVLSIGVFRLDATQDSHKPSAGTGGFALIGQAALPVVQDLNTEAGRQFFALNDRDVNGVNVVSFRVREGDEASCLNLNRAQRPRLLGVRLGALQGRFTFTEVAKGLKIGSGWDLLQTSSSAAGQADEEEIPAIGDANSIQWAMGKSIGDSIEYIDERGRKFKVRLVGAIANSILQGNLIIDEAQFEKRFPSESGYRFFLIDTPASTMTETASSLSRALRDQGLELTPAVQRLDEFNAVQNTYLGTFQILGGLGLLLGSAGLGGVVLRNVFERRGELGLLSAVGFRKTALHWLVLSEHTALLTLGLALGIFCAWIAVLPALLSPAHALPYGSLSITLAAVLLNGLVWTWLATGAALKGDVLSALRND